MYNEQDFNRDLRSRINALPKDYSLTPIIYHKTLIKDSVINHVQFKEIWWGDKKIDPRFFDIVYKQDTLLLLLDKKLPDFKLKDLNDKIFSSSQLLGKPTLIDFWGLNCQGCIEEMPRLNTLREKYKEKVNFIAVCTDDYPSDSIRHFLKKRPFDFYHLVGGRDYSFKTLKISGLPVNMFLDKDGYVREIKNVSGLNNEDFIKILDKLLKK
jgi:thiol-disulfide isomerase/thioredoxin